MPKNAVTHLLIDTSCLRHAGDNFGDPDFQKLLIFAKRNENPLRIYIPHIVWEERRTQLLEAVVKKHRTANEAFNVIREQSARNILLQGLDAPSLTIWGREDLDGNSRRAMSQFATDNKITVVPLAEDHAERAWKRYFAGDLPFDPKVPDRHQNRKHIPDSWIFETAIDLLNEHPSLCAACDDGGLSDALKSIGIRVFTRFRQVVEEIEQAEIATIAEQEAAQVPPAPADIRKEADSLKARLAEARAPIDEIDSRVLGYVSYFGSPSKHQLFQVTSKAGISEALVKNAAERLVLAKLITDTGNHYLISDTAAGALAARVIEDEVVDVLLKE
jgi:hypothetical protein